MAFDNIGLICGSVASFIFWIFWLKESKNKGRKFIFRYFFVFVGAIFIILTNFLNIPKIFEYNLGNKNLLYIAFACLCAQLVVDICCAIFVEINKLMYKYK